MKHRIAPIVEGQGEVEAVPILLRRVWTELLAASGLEVLKPVRQPRLRLARADHLMKAVALALLKLGGAGGLVLLLIDNDPAEEPPCELAPTLTRIVREARSDADFACVLANPEYETWFAAAADSLRDAAELPQIPQDVEAARMKKAWVQRHLRSNYSPTVDQPALTSRMDLSLCRRRSASFDKLCRELEAFRRRRGD